MSWILDNSLTWYHKFCIKVLKSGPIPQHIAFIMDGNRRYANKENVKTVVGHTKGFEKLGEALVWCRELGINEVTVYAFSIENFKRSKEEVDTLMALACDKFEKLLEQVHILHSNGICIRIIGNLLLIPERLRANIAKAQLLTKNNKKAFINIAFAYTAQDEIANSFQVIQDGIQRHEIESSDVSEFLISKCMYNVESTRPDILIRTSGEVRFSDFLLWQTYNTNVIFQKVLWPDFCIWHLLACIFYYQVFYSKQKGNEEKMKFNDDVCGSERVQRFIQNLEIRRVEQLQEYANLFELK